MPPWSPYLQHKIEGGRFPNVIKLPTNLPFGCVYLDWLAGAKDAWFEAKLGSVSK